MTENNETDQAQTLEINNAITSKFANIDVEMFEGNQPIYDLIISME